MKIQIEQINKFKVTIDGRTYDNFEECESWEGFLKFSSPDGIIIVEKEEASFIDSFPSIFGGRVSKIQIDFNVVKMSKSLIPAKENKADGK